MKRESGNALIHRPFDVFRLQIRKEVRNKPALRIMYIVLCAQQKAKNLCRLIDFISSPTK